MILKAIAGLSFGAKLISGLILAGTLTAGILYIRSTWIERGRQEQRAEQVEATRKNLEAQKAIFEEQLSKAEAREAEARALIVQTTAALQQNATALRALSQQRQQVTQQVAAIPDSGLRPALEAELGGSLDLPWVLRKNLDIVRQVPIDKQEIARLTERVEIQEQRVAAQDQRISAVQEKLDLTYRWADQVYAAYIEAFNAVPRRARSARCLWIWRCGQGRKLSSPTPEQLLTNRPRP